MFRLFVWFIYIYTHAQDQPILSKGKKEEAVGVRHDDDHETVYLLASSMFCIFSFRVAAIYVVEQASWCRQAQTTTRYEIVSLRKVRRYICNQGGVHETSLQKSPFRTRLFNMQKDVL